MRATSLDRGHRSAHFRGGGRHSIVRTTNGAHLGGKIVGFIIVFPSRGGAGELSKVFVARPRRGRGVGTMLIARALEAAKKRGYVSLHLSTNKAFPEACAYYERHRWVRRSADDAASIIYAIRLREVPVLPPPPPLLHGVLALLEKFTRLRERLRHDLFTGSR